jgi:hypothetical protein
MLIYRILKGVYFFFYVLFGLLIYVIKKIFFKNSLMDEKSVCDRMVKSIFDQGTLYDFPRIWHYVSSEDKGNSWQDMSRHQLICSLIKSTFFEEIPKEAQPSMLKYLQVEGFYRCKKDDSIWYFTSNEWRMGAEKYLLKNYSMPPAAKRPERIKKFVPPSWFATAGYAPKGERLTIEMWRDYLMYTKLNKD